MPDKLVSPSSGLSNSDLTKANAGTGDVIAGKTFYAGNKELKTGTRSHSEGKYGTFTSLQNEELEVQLGFQPSKIMLVYLYSGDTNATILWDKNEPAKYLVWMGNNHGAKLDNTSTSGYGQITPISNGFSFRGYYTSSGNQTIQYMAIS